MPTYDFDGVEAAEAAPQLEPGDYVAKVIGVEDTTSQGGTPGVKLRLRLERTTAGDAVNREWSDTWWLTAKTAPYNAGRILTLTGAAPGKGFDFQRLVGKRAIAVLRRKTNESSGKEYLDVVGYNKLPDSEQDPLAAAAAATQAAFPGSSQIGPANANDDDIPF